MTAPVLRQEGAIVFRADGVAELTDTWVPPVVVDDGEQSPPAAPSPAPAPVVRLPKAGRDLDAILAELEARVAHLDREIEARAGMVAERRNIQRLIRAAQRTRTK